MDGFEQLVSEILWCAPTLRRAAARAPLRRIDWHYLAVNEPVEQVTKLGEPQLDAWRRE